MMNRRTNVYLMLSITALVSMSLTLVFTFSVTLFQFGDNGGYLSLGIAFAEGKGFTNPALPGSMHFLWWPPGFPLFIALFYTVIGPHWYVLKVILFVALYLSLVLYAITLYNREKRFSKAALILIAAGVSSGIHLLSSYLYSEIFFIIVTLSFFFLWQRWHENLTVPKVLILSFFALYVSSVRLIGAALPVALVVYLARYGNQCGSGRWRCIIPGIIFLAYLALSLFYPPLRVGSLRVVFGLHPEFAVSLLAGGPVDESVNLTTIICRYGEKTALFIRGYGLSLIPQALIRTAYDLYAMNWLKALIMASVTGIVAAGWCVSFKKYRLMNIYVFLYMAVLFVYGPLYVRLLVPIIPFLFLYLYSGLETVAGLLTKKRGVAAIAVACVWALVIFDNGHRTFTDPRRTMPPEFGDRAYQECLEWIVDHAARGETVLCQVYSYLYIRRGQYCIPFIDVRTPNEFMAYCDAHAVDYIVISPFHATQETYMVRAVEAAGIYSNKFEKIFGGKNAESYILKYRQSTD